MTKSALISAVAATANLSRKAAEEVINATFETLARGLKKAKRVQVPGFGTFSVRARKARNGRNPPDRGRYQDPGEPDRGVQTRVEPKERTMTAFSLA